MATQGAPKPEPSYPPLARDALGNRITIPDGTAAWRICRQTTGRPKEIVGPDKRALRFPLETTADELADLCGADVYRVYALDEVGTVLDYVTTVDATREARELRNAGPEAPALPAPRAAAAAPSSDLRFALEAMGQMMRVNSEALRAVTETQADCVKAIVAVRGFFRNGAASVSPELPPDDDADNEEEDDEPAPSKTIYDVLAPIAEHCAPSVGPLVSMLAGGVGGQKALGAAPAAAEGGESDLASKPRWELRDLVDLRYAAAKAQAKKAAKQASGSGGAKASLQARVMADPKLMAHFLAIKSLPQPEEAAQILALGEHTTEAEQELLIANVSALSPADAAALLRATLAELTKATTPTESDA